MKERSGMPYDVVAYEADDLAMQLNEAEEGLFHRMLRRAWMNGSIPNDIKQLALICRTRPSTMRKAWTRISPLWREKEDEPGRLVNAKQESERAFKDSFRTTKSIAGQQGNAEKRRQRMKLAREKGTHTDQEWELLKDLTGHRCVKCHDDEHRVEKDHILSVYQGGSDAIENIQPLCARCNAKKGPDNIDYVDTAVRTAVRLRTHIPASPSPSPPLPLLIPNLSLQRSSVLHGVEEANERTNGNEPSEAEYQKFWGPVEGFLRQQVVDESFQTYYAGTTVLGMTSQFVTLAVPPALIERDHDPETTAKRLAHTIEIAGTGFLRGRSLRVVPLKANGAAP